VGCNTSQKSNFIRVNQVSVDEYDVFEDEEAGRLIVDDRDYNTTATCRDGLAIRNGFNMKES
jgi:hypothetical protein